MAGTEAVLTERLAALRHMRDLRATWQGRALGHATGQMAAVMLSVLAHNYEGALPVLLTIVFPGFAGVRAPFFCSAARIMQSGQVAADLVTKTGRLVKRAEVFKSELAMQDAFRRLADEIKASDRERVELFDAVKNWVVADFRLDPTMDRNDPDAKHSTLN